MPSIWDTLFGGGDQTTTTTQTPQIPGFIQQPLESVFARAGAESERPYTPYGQPRLAPTSNFENASYNRLGQMFGVPFNQQQANNNSAQVSDNDFGPDEPIRPPHTSEQRAELRQRLSQQPPRRGTPNGINTMWPGSGGAPWTGQGQPPGSATPNRPQYEAPVDYATTLAASAGERGLDPGQFTDPGTANAYMSPYMESVIQSSQDETRRSAAGDRQALDTQAAQMGAFGGGRHSVLEAERQRNLNRLVSDIGVRGRQSAFENAQTQYNADRGARLSGLNPALQASQGIGNLATTGQTLGLQGVNAINQAGQQQRGTQQSSLDLAYQDFVNQRQYPQGQIQFLSDIIRGNQPQPGQTTTATQSGGQPSFLAQGLGAGLGAYTLGRGFNLFRKGGAVKSSFADGGSIKMQAGGAPPIVIAGRQFTREELYSLPVEKLEGLLKISPQHERIIGPIMRQKNIENPANALGQLKRGIGSAFEAARPYTPEERIERLLPQSKQVSDVPFGPPMPEKRSSFDSPKGGKIDYNALKVPPWSTFEKGRTTSGGLPSPTTLPPKPQESDFFDRLNQPAFAAAMRMMGAQRGENLFQTLGAAGTAALTQRGAMKKEAREETKEKLERDKFGLETRKTGADIEESRSRGAAYSAQAEAARRGTPIQSINKKTGDLELIYGDGKRVPLEGLQPITIANMEGKDETTRRAKAVDSILKLQANIAGNMTVLDNDTKQQQFLDGAKSIYRNLGLEITEQDRIEWQGMMAAPKKK